MRSADTPTAVVLVEPVVDRDDALGAAQHEQDPGHGHREPESLREAPQDFWIVAQAIMGSRLLLRPVADAKGAASSPPRAAIRAPIAGRQRFARQPLVEAGVSIRLLGGGEAEAGTAYMVPG